MTEIPHRFSEGQFRRYEKYINYAIEAYPQAIKCDPVSFDVATATFIARLRDAMKSYETYKWPSTINPEKFTLAYPQIQVIQRVDGTILIGPRMATQQWGKQDGVKEVVVEIINAIPNTCLLLCTYDEKDLLMRLSHNRWLAPSLKVKGLSYEEAETFQKQYDIAIDDNNDGTFTLI